MGSSGVKLAGHPNSICPAPQAKMVDGKLSCCLTGPCGASFTHAIGIGTPCFISVNSRAKNAGNAAPLRASVITRFTRPYF
jgi:hypothetical protein